MLVERALTSADGEMVLLHGYDGQSMSLRPLPSGGPALATPRPPFVRSATTIAVETLLGCNAARAAAAPQQCPGDWASEDKGLAAGLPQFVHLVSLDVEGLELDVLERWPFASLRVGAWIVEHNNRGLIRQQIIELLQKHGYKWLPVENAGVDDYFIDKKYAEVMERNVTSGYNMLSKPWRRHPHGAHGC